MPENQELTLNEDQCAVIIKKARDVQFAMSTLMDFLKNGNGSIDEELTRNVLGVSEHYLADIGKEMGVPTQSEADIEERHARLRAANMRVRELEELVGAQQTPEMTQMALKNMADHLNAWWDYEGFGHISNIHFGQYGCEVDFCCMLFGNFHVTNSPTPVSDKERKRLWHESLIERGFVLTSEDRDICIEDCDQNRKTLLELFAQRLPSAKVSSFENQYKRDGGFVMRGVKVYVRNIAEFLTLPVPPKSEG